MPEISVIIPAKNAEKTIAQSLHSLAIQTFRDFEVLVINDGSSDKTDDILYEFRNIINLKVVRNIESIGVADSINKGILATDSAFIVRLDSDDLAVPNRLERQYDFMRNNCNIDICGSYLYVFADDLNKGGVLMHPTNNEAIKTAFLQRCAVAHPSLIIRREIFDGVGLYNSSFDFAEDYELWCRASMLGAKFANIPEMLTCYRRHDGQVSQIKAHLQIKRDYAIKRRYISGFIDCENIELLAEFFSLNYMYNDREALISALTSIIPSIIDLGKKIPDSAEYNRIIKSSIGKVALI